MGIFRRFGKNSAVPDIQFAARGFTQVALTRQHAPHLNLHTLERGFAEELMQEGCSLEEALSARWGGSYAITADLGEFRRAIDVVKDTMEEQRGSRAFGTKEEAEAAYQAAAVCIMGTAHSVDPKEYGRFLEHIGAR